jgi:hypothetical protein
LLFVVWKKAGRAAGINNASPNNNACTAHRRQLVTMQTDSQSVAFLSSIKGIGSPDGMDQIVPDREGWDRTDWLQMVQAFRRMRNSFGKVSTKTADLESSAAGKTDGPTDKWLALIQRSVCKNVLRLFMLNSSLREFAKKVRFHYENSWETRAWPVRVLVAHHQRSVRCFLICWN